MVADGSWQGCVLTVPATSVGLPLEGVSASPGGLDKFLPKPPKSFSFRRPGVQPEYARV